METRVKRDREQLFYSAPVDDRSIGERGQNLPVKIDEKVTLQRSAVTSDSRQRVNSTEMSGYREYIKCVVNNNEDGCENPCRNIFSRVHHFHGRSCTICSKVLH